MMHKFSIKQNLNFASKLNFITSSFPKITTLSLWHGYSERPHAKPKFQQKSYLVIDIQRNFGV